MTPAAEIDYRVRECAGQTWPSEEAIAAAQAESERGSSFDRSWSSFDLSDCTHPVEVMAEVAGWNVTVCVRCGHVERPSCAHPAGFEWNDAGTLLRCRTCGVDGS